jgi:hypothetical protein
MYGMPSMVSVGRGPATSNFNPPISFYNMDADPRGWRTEGSYWSIGAAAPLEATIAPDSAPAGYAGPHRFGIPGVRALSPDGGTAMPGGTSWGGYGVVPASLVQFSYPTRYPFFSGYFPGGQGVPGAQSPFMLPALALAGMVVLAGVWSDRGKGRK